jgi:hypothetical protein
VKPVFLLGCYGCISHGVSNSARLSQSFGISEGGCRTPHPWYAAGQDGSYLVSCIGALQPYCKRVKFVGELEQNETPRLNEYITIILRTL